VDSGFNALALEYSCKTSLENVLVGGKFALFFKSVVHGSITWPTF